MVYLPSSAFESSVVGSDASCDDGTSSLYEAGYNSECAFYNKAFALYNGTPNYADAVPTTGTSALPGQLALSVPAELAMTEKLITGRVDANLGPNDKMFGHFKYDHGVQPSYTDPINSAFDADSNQPDYEGQFAETHTFGTKAVNQFFMSGSWYSAAFVNPDPTTELATFPFDMYWDDGFASDLNNLAEYWPEGRNVTQYQIGDDLSYTTGGHTFKAGFNYKKNDLSDYDTGVYNTPLIYVEQGGYTPPAGETEGYWSGFEGGTSDEGVQNFPVSLNLPLSLYTLGLYFEDDWKPTPKAMITAGIRVERNSNVTCLKNCLSNFGGSFFSQAGTTSLGSASGAYNSQIKYNLPTAFNAYQRYMIEPRIGFTYSPDTKTVVRGGFGYFADVFPGTIADDMLDNPPLNLAFYVENSGMEVNPSDPSSAQSLMAGANNTFQNCTFNPTSCFKNGGSYTSMSSFNPLFEAPSFTTVAGTLHYPTYEEWNLQIQRAISRTESIQIGYVGNRGYHEPVQNVGVNANAGAYGLPAASPAPSFGPVNEVESSAVSNYNGFLVSYLIQGHGLNMQLNYSWSHALDEISNGGILPFNTSSIAGQINPYDLRQNYGNADYDIPQSFSGTYLYQMPYFGGSRVLTEGWELGGTIFYNGGTPFTPTAYVGDFGVGNYGSEYNPIPIAAAPGTPHHCGPSAATTPCLTPADFPNYYVDGAVAPTVSPFGAIERNQFFGPHYFDTDMTLLKGFKLPHLGDQGKFEAGLTAFNLFNHPSFGLPVTGIDSSQFGLSLYAEGPPTTIYGSGLGGDPTIRIVEFTGRFMF